MKSAITILSLFTATVAALPVTAGAQAYPATGWLSVYQPLPISGGGPVTTVNLSPNGDVGQSRAHPLPPGFDFRFFGTPFSKINIGAKGYITFGDLATDHTAASASPSSLEGTSNPRSLAAAWWGNHFCDQSEGELQTQVLGEAPDRVFVIQWHCRRSSGSFQTGTRFQAQLWLYETSDVIRASYGQLVVEPGNDWGSVAWGLKAETGVGTLGPGREGEASICDPTGTSVDRPRCQALDHFPASATLQYGHFSELDLTAKVSPGSIAPVPSGMELESTTTFRNLSTASAAEVDYDVYLSRTRHLDPGSAQSVRIHRSQAPVAVGAGASIEVEGSYEFPSPGNGTYYVCVHVDPEEKLQEVDKRNNLICSRGTISIGPDITGSITAPAGGEAGDAIQVPIEIRNIGTEPAGSFAYVIIIDPETIDGIPVPAAEIHFARLEGGLAPGEAVQLTIDTQMPAVARGDFYTFVLELDVLRELDEVNIDNNVVESPNKFVNRKPHLVMTRPLEPILPDGCYFGEEIYAVMEACNLGDAAATRFFPGVVMGALGSISLLTDVEAATFPQSCHAEESINHHACEPVAGIQPSCVRGRCTLHCEVDGDCVGGMVCRPDDHLAVVTGDPGAKSCANFLDVPGGEAPNCQTFTLRGRIPVEDKRGAWYQDADLRFHFTDDVSFSLSETLPDQFAGEPMLCREALPDLTPVQLTTSSRMYAGEVALIERTIENLGFIEIPRDGSERPAAMELEYGYFISKVPEVSVRQIRLPLENPSTQLIGRKGSNVGLDRVRLPANLNPGEYYLALIVDPEGKTRELSKSNNRLIYQQRIVVEPSVLQIRTKGLPTAVVGKRFTFQLVADGSAEDYRWSADELPPGLNLREDGLLHGVLEDAGIFSFSVQLRSGARSLGQMFALRVVPPLGSLFISTQHLPTAVVGAVYGGDPGGGAPGVQLAASGGQPPYRWELDSWSEALPDGLEGPSEEGVIQGTATEDAFTSTIRVRVRDRLGNTTSKELRIPVVARHDLNIVSPFFAEGTTARSYDACVEAIGGASHLGYEWTVDRSTVPPGLEVEQRDERACLVGTPLACASYLVRVMVQDADGQSDLAMIPLTVECERIQLIIDALPPVRRGEEVDFLLESDTSEAVDYRLIDGMLPPGLELDPTGRIHGTVDEDAAFGPYSFAMRIRDELGRMGMGAMSAEVLVEPAQPRLVERKSGGCASGGGGSSGLSLALAGLALLGGRRLRRSKG